MKRKQRGSTVTETGPALLLLFIVIFFPLVDLLSISLLYCTGWYTNYTISNQAARARESDRDRIVADVQQQFYKSGFASFLGLKDGDLKTEVIYPPVTDGVPPTVRVSTTVTGKPFILLPAGAYVPSVPGLSAPVTFTLSEELTRESTLK